MSAIYIPTKNKPESLIKCVRAARLAAPGIPIYIVSETQYSRQIESILELNGWNLVIPVWITKWERGLAFARNVIVRDAIRRGYESIAQVDDDQILKGDVEGWLDLAVNPDVTGIGAWKSIYGLYNQGTMMARSVSGTRKRPGLFLSKGGQAYQSFALNVANAHQIGFDQFLLNYEDQEFCRECVKGLGLPWRIFTGVTAGDVMSQKKARATGVSRASTGDVEREAHRVSHSRWPAYVSPPDKPYRVQWRKFYEEFLPRLPWPLENIRNRQPWDWEK